MSALRRPALVLLGASAMAFSAAAPPAAVAAKCVAKPGANASEQQYCNDVPKSGDDAPKRKRDAGAADAGSASEAPAAPAVVATQPAPTTPEATSSSKTARNVGLAFLGMGALGGLSAVLLRRRSGTL